MEPLLTEKELAGILHVSEGTVRDWRTRRGTSPRGPRAIRVVGAVRYRPEDVRAWLDGLPGTDDDQAA